MEEPGMKRWIEKSDRRSFRPLRVNKAEVRLLTDLLINEIVIALGFSPDGVMRHLLRPFVYLPARRFSTITARFDTIVSDRGLGAACRWALPYFTAGVKLDGWTNIPETGPLLVVGNHPGIVDAMALAGFLPRNDVRVIASGIPFMRGVPNAAEYLIYSSHQSGDRVRVLRESIRHLRRGGALVVLPGGRVEPDPARFPGAVEAVERWSPSVALMVRSVHELQVVVAASGGMLSRGSMKSPLTLLGNTQIEKQKIAEFAQVIQQMLLPDAVTVSPRVYFSEAFRPLLECSGTSVEEVMNVIINRAQLLIRSAFYCRGSHSIP